MSLFNGVGIEGFHCIEVSSFQRVVIERFHCIKRCPHYSEGGNRKVPLCYFILNTDISPLLSPQLMVTLFPFQTVYRPLLYLEVSSLVFYLVSCFPFL